MKTITLFCIGLAAQLSLFGQAVPNGTFENWTSTPYMDANTWNSSNFRDIQRMGIATVTKVAGYLGGSAIRVETKVLGSDTSESYFLNIKDPCDDPQNWKGGVPYAQKPTAITGYCRYNLPGQDTAIMLVIFRKNGVHIGDNLIKIRNSSGIQNTFTSFSYTVTCTGTPDSIIIAAAASNKISNQGIQNGSFIEFDKLAFSGTTQAIPEGDFENWTSYSFDKADYWNGWGNGVTRSTSSYAGTYAMRIETMGDCGGSNVNPSGITTGYMTENNGPDGGRLYTLQSDTLFGYYKYIPQGQDTAGIYVNLSKNNVNIGGNYLTLTAASNYTLFKIPFGAGQAPDTLRIDIASSKWNANSSNLGSVLYIDNVYLKSQSLGIFDSKNKSPEIRSYPNPVKDILFLETGALTGGSLRITVYNALGQEVKGVTLSASSKLCQVDVSALGSGIYFYEVESPAWKSTGRFVKQ